MSDSARTIIIISGLILIVTVYILLYTPLADLIFAPKVRPLAVQPFAPIIVAPPEVKVEAPTRESISTFEAQIPKFVTLRDPFEVDYAYKKVEVTQAPGETKPKEAKPAPRYLILQGVFMSGGVKTAIIDDRVVSLGSRVALGWRVSDIREDMVILRMGGKIKYLRIK